MRIKRILVLILIFTTMLSFNSSFVILAPVDNVYGSSDEAVEDNTLSAQEDSTDSKDADDEESVTEEPSEETAGKSAGEESETQSEGESETQSEEDSGSESAEKESNAQTSGTAESNQTEKAQSASDSSEKNSDTEGSEDADREEADDEENSDLKKRTIEVELQQEEIYKETGNTEGSDPSEEAELTAAVKQIRKYWRALTGRKADIKEDTSEEPPFTIKIKGKFPEEVSAYASYVEFDETAAAEASENGVFDETIFYGFDLVIYDGNGKVYVPDDPVKVIIESKRVSKAVKEEDALHVYSYAVNKERAEEYSKKYDQKIYAADVLTYRTDNSDKKRLYYKVYKEDKDYKDTEDAVRYTENKDGIRITDKKTLVFEFKYDPESGAGSNAEKSKAAAHFVLSAQLPADKVEEIKAQTEEKRADAEAAKKAEAERAAEEQTEDKKAAEKESAKKQAEKSEEQQAEKSEEQQAEKSEEQQNEKAAELVQYEKLATDGKTYRITVSYDSESGIPEDAKLVVKEIRKSDFGYNNYVEKSAAALGEKPRDLTIRKAFDITLKDSQTGEEYQPEKDVQVCIELLDDLNHYGNVKVVHIPDNAQEQAEVMDTTIQGESVAFDTNGFSVYVVTEDSTTVTPQCIFKFYKDTTGTEQVSFTDEDGNTVYSQVITDGSQLVIPQVVSTDDQVFAGWYEGAADGSGGITLEEEAYDFDNIVITENSEVDLYAVYKEYAEVVFHDQYDSDSETFPVAYTDRGELTGDEGSMSALVQIDDKEISYSTTGDEEMGFYGWSLTPVTTPGSETDDNGDAVTAVTTDDDGCITITEETHLYPIFKKICWLTFYAASAGNGAAYNGPQSLFTGEGLDSLPVTSMSGYTFTGWFTGTITSTDGTDTVNYGTQISDALGSLIAGADDSGVYVSGGKLYLRSDTRLFAGWEANTTAEYKILYWKESGADAGADSGDETYLYAESKTVSDGIVGETVSVADEDKANDRYSGYHLKADPDSAEVEADGSTVLNVYYDLDDGYTATDGNYTLTFSDSITEDGSISGDLPVKAVIAYGEDLTEYVIEDPASGRKGYTFSKWYLDPYCTQEADLDSMRMPDQDLTVYAGWDVEWYIVNIDPNYGELRPLVDGVPTGTGSTWFWQNIEREPISEYSYVERNYVESSSGSWYYVYHPGDGEGGSEWPDRYTYYTQDPSLSTEDTTFEYSPGTYTYAGWYEVNDDGTETPYTFGERTDHNTSLKLHWKKSGVYYLAYDAGDGTLEDGETTETVLTDAYADCAEVILEDSAIAPDGYTFVGWQVRDSDSDTIYTTGQTFTLSADDAKRVSGKDIVYLDAVYVKIDTASIVYNANGGTVSDTEGAVDFGALYSANNVSTSMSGTVDTDAGTATVSGLSINSKIRLSDGSGFTAPEDSGATFRGWSDQAVCDDAANFYDSTSTTTVFGVDNEDPEDLYAVWSAEVTYNLNSTDASWGDDAWDTDSYTLDSDTNVYSQTVYLGNTIPEPSQEPVYSGSDGRLFRYWATRSGSGTDEDPYVYTEYDFTQPVTGALDLYAYWSEPNTIEVHAVDASDETLTDKTDDESWTVTDLTVSTEETSLTASSHVTAPENYEFAFAAAVSEMDAVSESDAVTAVIYEDKTVKVKYEGDTTYTALDDGSELYFVYYEKKALNIGYKSMDESGVLSDVTVTRASETTGDDLLGTYVMSDQITNALSLADGYTNYSFAIGSVDPEDGTQMDASDLHLITDAADSEDDPPTLLVKNTWRGFQYTKETGDDAAWIDCGYEPQLYVIYYTKTPTVVMFSEETIGTSDVIDTEFRYDLLVTQLETTEVSVQTQVKDSGGDWTNDGDAVVTTDAAVTKIFDTTDDGTFPYILKNGEADSAILFYGSAEQVNPEENGDTRTVTTTTTVTSQSIVITQTANDDFTTAVNGTTLDAEPYEFTYTSVGSGGTQEAVFTNTHKSLPVEVHVAMVEEDDSSSGIIQQDATYRSTTESDYTFDLELGGSETLLTKLPSDALFTGDTDTYAFGAVVSGAGTEGSAVSVDSMGAVSIAYEQTDDNIYELVLRDSDGNSLGELGSNQLYYLYYPMPKIKYVKEDTDGTLTEITGCLLNSETGVIEASDSVTYSHEALTMNGLTVAQNQSVEIPLSGFVISQSGNKFRMPPVLDDGLFELYLSYDKLGAGSGDAQTVSDLDVSSDLYMQLKVQNNTLQYSFDDTTWNDLPLSGTPTIYAIYTERGYDLQITKTIDMSDSGEDEIFSEASFPVTISSLGITKDSYEAEGYESSEISATAASGSTPGTITLTVEDGTKVRIKGLGQGEYTITESENEEYSLAASSSPIVGGTSTALPVDDNSSVLLTLDQETKVDLVNSPKALCKIDDDGTYYTFYTLKDAVQYVKEYMSDGTATIEMLTDYRIPAADILTVPSGYNITLTTAEDGFSGDGSLAVIKRTSKLADSPLLINYGTLTLSNITIDGNDISSSEALVESEGDLTIGAGAVLKNAVNSGNGGAVYATDGDITVKGTIGSDDEEDGNTAASGGAIYYTGSGTITISGSGTIQNNVASEGNGGAIYASAGTITMTGYSSLSDNKAESGNGGAVYAQNAAFNLSESASLTDNTAAAGGAVYAAKGAVTVSASDESTPSVSGNTASTGNGGAFWTGSGSFTLSGGTLYNNSAASGNGGAVYANSASVTISGGTIGGTDSGVANTAQNGAALFVNTGSATFSGGSITGNEATAGGAVGIGSDTVRLYFTDAASITGNTMESEDSNVYLDQDSDMVINAVTLSDSASVGIYVPGDDDLFTNRGDIGAYFGSYSDSTNNLSAFSNDRISGLSVATDTDRSKIYWSSPVSVELRYLEHFNSGFPPAATGSSKYTNTSYDPDGSDIALSVLAEDVRTTYGVDIGATEAVYAAAFAEDASEYEDYLTRLFWDNSSCCWKVEKRDGTEEELGSRKLIMYYSLPAYFEIENNTEYDLELSELSVTVNSTSHSVINTSSTAGYGLVFAKNGAIQTSLLPLEGDDSGQLTLAQGEAVTLLMPGARGREYTLTGTFSDGATGDIRTRFINGSTTEETTVQANDVSITGRVLNNNNNTYQIIFGDDKYICKIVDKDDDNEDRENRFATIADALAYARTNQISEVKIQMLVDYLMPASDVLEITETDVFDSDGEMSADNTFTKVELTTATSGTYQYSGTDESSRATISRANGNTENPLVTVLRDGTLDTEVYVHDLDFDGKSVQGNINGGAIMTKYCKVTVEDSDFKNFIANNGGAVFVSYGTAESNFDYLVTEGYDTDEDTESIKSLASFTNCEFTDCRSKVTSGDRMGGGAIWTNGRKLYMEDCDFTTCSAGLQAGAVFHRIEMRRTDRPCQPYARLSQTYVTGCTFTDCSADANAGGGMESDAFDVTLEDSTFTDCVAKKSHGGGFNTYIAQKGSGVSWGSDYKTTVNVSGCTFTGCTASLDGGGFHSASNTTTVQNTTFDSCSARLGGALGLNNGQGGDDQTADAATLQGVIIRNCSSTGQGGAVYANTLNLTVQDYTYTDSSDEEQTIHTEISSCTAGGNGGAITHNRTKNNQTDSVTLIEGATISNCTSTWYGGGVYFVTRNMTMTDCTVQNCTSNGGTQYSEGGGGVYFKGNDTNNSTGTIDNCTITGNKASYMGGGVFTPCALVLCNGTSVTGNIVENAAYGGGVYVSKTLTVGTAALYEAEEADDTTVSSNTTSSGVVSNMRLPESNGVNTNTVTVLCDLSGYIGVVNANKAGTQFGTSPNSTEEWRPDGLSDSDAVFQSDNNTLYGIIDRTDTTGQKIIWAGSPICKLTDGDGNLLYFKDGGSDPAIFDKLDDGGSSANRSSPFSYLRNGSALKLYYEDGTLYNENDYCIKMLVESYTANTRIYTKFSQAMNVTLTTAGESDADYPYTGHTGTYATIYRGTSIGTSTNTFEFQTNNKQVGITIKNITLDGNKDIITVGTNSRLLNLSDGNGYVTVTLGENGVLQNAENGDTTNGGGAVYMWRSHLIINGGTIRNCSSPHGGAVVVEGNPSVASFTFKAGNITNCTATGKGGAVWLRNLSGHVAEMTMEGGTISRCSGAEGGAVYIDNYCKLHMTGGSIVSNSSTTRGGGIAFGNNNARLNLSQRINISGNTCDASDATNNINNVELNYDSNAIINTNNGGLYSGSYVGIYVPDGDYYYDKHGEEGDPFGTFADGDNTNNLYCFVNDRNGLKGGLKVDPDPNTIYWVQIFSLTVSKEIETSSGVTADEDEEFSFTVNIRGSASSAGQKSAKEIDTTVEGEYGEMWFTSNGTDTTTATFTLKAGESITGTNLSSGLTYEVIENLTDDQEEKYAALPSDIIEGTIGENSDRTDIDPYTSTADFVNMLPVCKITNKSGGLLYRKYTVDSDVYYVPAVYTELTGDEGAFSALDGTLYQSNTGTPVSYSISNGVQIQMLTSDYILTEALEYSNSSILTLTTASSTASAFPYQGTSGTTAMIRRGYNGDSMFDLSGTMILTDITLDGRKSSYASDSDGGIVNVGSGGILTIKSGAVLQKSMTSEKGGAVYVDDSGTVVMTGGSINKNESDGNGAGIYLTEGSSLKLSGAPYFGGKGTDVGGNITMTNGNWNTDTFIGYNGGVYYEQARQDIYIEGYYGDDGDTSASSLTVNGDITSGAGTIWVWAAQSPHYKTLQQFAKYTSDVTDIDTSLAAFRNARLDSLTGADEVGHYLYGVKRSDDSGKNVFWYGVEGSHKVILRKTDDEYAPVEDAVFEIHVGSPSGSLLSGTDIDGNETSSFTSGESGVYYIDTLPYGTYYIEETTVPSGYSSLNGVNWFILTVGEEGAGYEQADGTIINQISPETSTPS